MSNLALASSVEANSAMFETNLTPPPRDVHHQVSISRVRFQVKQSPVRKDRYAAAPRRCGARATVAQRTSERPGNQYGSAVRPKHVENVDGTCRLYSPPG